jgi:excisionase family DNA binding protein
MDDLLTTKELQELLKVDRTTVYRMLKDGRLTGIKIGEQWRFSREEVNSLLSGSLPPAVQTPASPEPRPGTVLPLHCVQRIQNVFADVAGTGAVTTDATGQPLTEMSNSCHFCSLILASESGRQACAASWAKLAEQSGHAPRFATCHAGLQYARARIELNGRLEAMLISGQFYAEAPTPNEEAARIQHLAERYKLDPETLAEAAQEIQVLDEHKQARIGEWLQSVAHTFEEIGCERAELMGRLHRIAEMSTLQPA